MSRRIEDSVIVITGASAGIGKALAQRLARMNARLVLAARRIDRLEALNHELGSQHLTAQVDVSKPAECHRLIERTIEHFGRIDTLVCNAGYGVASPIMQTKYDEIEQLFRTNVFGTIDCIQAAVPAMSRQGVQQGYRGQIVIVSSAAARRGLPYFGTYSATKAAQLSLAEALRIELKPLKIAVTSVHPIGTDTDFFTTAASMGQTTMPPRSKWEVHQSPDTVARVMIRAMHRPRPEVWPFAPARLGLSIATLVPRLVDRIMSHHRRQLADANDHVEP